MTPVRVRVRFVASLGFTDLDLMVAVLIPLWAFVMWRLIS